MSAVIRPGLREQVLADPPNWALEPIQAWDDLRIRAMGQFVTQDYWTDQGSVNVFRVVGTEHVDYQGRAWLDFLETGNPMDPDRNNRMDRNLALHASHPDYYLQTQRKVPGMYYRSLDGLSWYVGADGNHRTCIARFYFCALGLTTLHGVTLNHTVVDEELFDLFQRLMDVRLERRMDNHLQVYRQALRREDTAGWKLDHYKVRLDYMTPEGCHVLLDAAGGYELLRELTAPPRRRWWGIAR